MYRNNLRNEQELDEIIFDFSLETEHLFKKGKIKNIGKKVVDKVKKAAEGVKKTAKKVGGKVSNAALSAAIAPLLPLKPAMKKMLNKKGVTYGNKFSDVVEAFAKTFLPKKNFESVDAEGKPLESLDPVTISIIVKAIFSFFKSIKDKKEAGKLSKDEEEIAESMDEGADALAEMDDEDAENELIYSSSTKKIKRSPGETPTKIGTSGNNNVVLLIAAIVGIAIISKNT